MAVYVVMVAVSMLCASQASRVQRLGGSVSTQHTLRFFSLLPFLLVMVLRFEVGTDWPIYNKFFFSISEGGEQFSEAGYNLINRIVYFFVKDSWAVIALVGVLNCCFVFKAIWDQSVNPAFSILMFVIGPGFFNSMNQLRQALAMAMLLYALKYVVNRKFLHYLLWVALATMIHSTAPICLLIYFLYDRKPKISTMAIVLIACAVLRPVLNMLIHAVVARTKYAWYFESVYDDDNFYLLGFVFTLCVLVLLLYYRYANQRKDKTYDFMVNMYYFSLVLLLFTGMIPAITRISSYLNACTPLLIPRMVMREENRTRRIILYLLVVGVYLVKILYDIYVLGWNGVVPYQTIFSR